MLGKARDVGSRIFSYLSEPGDKLPSPLEQAAVKPEGLTYATAREPRSEEGFFGRHPGALSQDSRDEVIRQSVEFDRLAPRPESGEEGVRTRSYENNHGVGRRFFEGLQKCALGALVHPFRLIDDHDLKPAFERPQIEPLFDFVTDLIDFDILDACKFDEYYVRVYSPLYLPAGGASALLLRTGRGPPAVEKLGEFDRNHLLTYPVGARKEV